MKIISFDVGIKNMAYCIFESSNSEPFNLSEWNVVSLVQTESQPKQYCNCKTKNKKIKEMFSKDYREPVCGNIGKYMKGSQIYCERHAKSQKEWIFLQPKHAIKKLKKMKIGELTEVIKELNVIAGKNKGETIKNIEEKSIQNIQKEKTIQCSETGLISIGKSMKQVFNEVLKNHNDITHVLIENQISPIANRMKTIQGMLAQYFIMKNDDINIIFVSSQNKLKYFDKHMETNTTSNYKANKKNGIFYCNELLDHKYEYLQDWKCKLQVKKKDDLADAFLQGIWYIENKLIVA